MKSSTNYKGFELSENESTLLSEQGDETVNEFFPNVGGKWIKLTVFLSSFFGIFGKKYLDYISEIEKKKKEVESQKNIKAN